MDAPELKLKASDYIRHRTWHGYVDDPYALHAIEHVGADAIMWGSDFPHARCTYPNTMKVIDRVFGHLDEEIRRDITFNNCARFYNFDLPAA